MKSLLARILLLSVLLAFIFHAVLMVVMALVGWNTDSLRLRSLTGADLFEASGTDWLWILLLWGIALLQSCLLLIPLPVTVASGEKTPLGPRVIAAAFLGGLFLAIPLFASVDLYYLSATADPKSYNSEPYVLAADVYGVAPHSGRGGWSWYTGSAAWLHRAAILAARGASSVDVAVAGQG